MDCQDGSREGSTGLQSILVELIQLLEDAATENTLLKAENRLLKAENANLKAGA